MTSTPRPAGTRIGVVGSLNLDRFYALHEIPTPGQTVHGRPGGTSAGGKGANQAAAAALLGADVQLVGAVGRDEAGDYLSSVARAHGVDVDALVRVEAPTGEAIILVDDDGENVIIVSGGANLALSADAVRGLDPAPGIIVTGFEVPDEAVIAAAALANAKEALFVLNPSPLRAVEPMMCAERMLVLVNESEARSIAGTEDEGAQPRAVSEVFGGSDVIVTRGSRGALVYEAADATVTHIDPRPVTAVDTSGCGDAYTGAVVTALARGEDLVSAAAYAREVGAMVATRPGTQAAYPTAAELANWLATQ